VADPPSPRGLRFRHPAAKGSSTSPPRALTAIADTADVTRRFVDAAADEIADELREALKG
jgi:hypothetical protein